MLSTVKRWRLEFEDWLRYHPRARQTISRLRLLRTRQPDVSNSQAVARTIVGWCTAARFAEDETREWQIQERIVELVKHLDPGRIDWREFVFNYDDPRLYKAAILKPYVGPREKGVLFASFETTWIRLLRPTNWRELAKRYTVVASPSSSPAHVLFNYAFPALFPGPVFTLISNARDFDVFKRMSPNLIPLPLYASNWVNPDLYHPIPKADRRWDLLMVASFGKVKRHHILFQALRYLPRETRVLLVGQDQDGRDANTIHETARWYGVADRYTLLANQPYAEVVKLFCQSRSSIVLSRQEGSCVVIAESFFADTPAAILRTAGIGSRAFINEQTGRFLDDATLASDLADFVKKADHYQPRAWAEQNISCYRSSQMLNDALKAKSLELGQEWTQDIAPLQWSPDPMLARPEDRQKLAGERADILARFGLEIGPPPLQ